MAAKLEADPQLGLQHRQTLPPPPIPLATREGGSVTTSDMLNLGLGFFLLGLTIGIILGAVLP